MFKLTIKAQICFLFFSVLVVVQSCNNTPVEATVADVDGNIYQTVQIGKQLWMAENLKATTFNDGISIPLITDNEAWHRLSSPAYCWYSNDSTIFGEEYGALYNYYAINSGKLCPTGWHVPTADDFKILLSETDPDSDFARHEASYIAGGKLKETGNLHWLEPNSKTTDDTGFSALPGGCRAYAGNYSMINTIGYYGSSTNEASLALRYSTGSAFFREGISGYVGVSVRCVKD